MATTFESRFPSAPNALAAGQTRSTARSARRPWIVYREHSEVSAQPPGTAPGRPCRGSAVGLLQLAGQISRDSDAGPTSARPRQGVGLFRALAHQFETSNACPADTRHVELDAAPARRYHRQGLESTWAARQGVRPDRMGELLSSVWNLPAALLHGAPAVCTLREPLRRGGGSVAFATPGNPIAVCMIARARRRRRSSTEHEGRKLGHVPDPASAGRPPPGQRSVVAPTPWRTPSTAFYVGVEPRGTADPSGRRGRPSA
jgi:hypothetical protein